MRKFRKLIYVSFAMLGFISVNAQVTYKLSAKSSIRISGTSTLSDWVVKSEGLSGEMIFTASEKKGKGKEIQTGVIKNAKAVLEVSSIKSEKGEAMDNKIYKALKNDMHPQITFLLTSPIQIQLKEPAKLSATGDIQLAGVTHPMTFVLNLSYLDNTLRFVGSKSLKFSDFEIEPPTAMFGQIETGDDIKIELDLFFNDESN